MVRVRIFYPADPVGIVPGGVDTFIRGIIKSAPDDVVISLVGMTTDTSRRPLGVWSTCWVGDRAFEFFPVVAVADAGQRGRIPLSVRYMAGVWRHQTEVEQGFDVFDFHRIEPMFLHTRDPRPKNVFFHQDPGFMRLTASDNLWRRWPAAYEKLEARAMRGAQSAWCVRESGVKVLRERYPALARRTDFVPTWVDTSVFAPPSEAARQGLRAHWAEKLGLNQAAQWIVSVGRLDTQKNPQRLLQAMSDLLGQGRALHWLVVGDGVLQAELKAAVARRGLTSMVHFLGLMAPAVIAEVLSAADVFALPSAYEGMPMALLEALACGLPAVVTDVGEVRRVVHPGVNGVIAPEQTDASFTAALREGLEHARSWRGEPARQAILPYQPDQVLQPVFDNYKALVAPAQWARVAGDQAPAASHGNVIGIKVHRIEREDVIALIMSWAISFESRYVCFCNAHSAVLATTQSDHRRALMEADLVAPDGAPVAWTLSLKHGQLQQRVDGPGTMLKLCKTAAEQGVKIGLLGSTPEVLEQLVIRLKLVAPGLDIAYVCSPPFRSLSKVEDEAVCADIAKAKVGLLFVGLGCPKQEVWMRAHRRRIHAVMLGVGAAFDFHAGTLPRAPGLMRAYGFEWFHRLLQEPRRLWWRYISYNTVFLSKSVLDIARIMGRQVKAWVGERLPR